jgi:hypothetical protein
MSFELADGTTMKLGRYRHLLDMVTPQSKIERELERWGVDPTTQPEALIDGQIFAIAQAGDNAYSNISPDAIEVLWLPQANCGAISWDGGAQWIQADCPQALFQTWAETNLQAEIGALLTPTLATW